MKGVWEKHLKLPAFPLGKQKLGHMFDVPAFQRSAQGLLLPHLFCYAAWTSNILAAWRPLRTKESRVACCCSKRPGVQQRLIQLSGLSLGGKRRVEHVPSVLDFQVLAWWTAFCLPCVNTDGPGIRATENNRELGGSPGQLQCCG